jgi:hypothetical protein
MAHSEEKKYFLDNQHNVRKIIGLFFTLCAFLIAVDIFFHRHLSFSDDMFVYESYFGFYAIYGFVACVFGRYRKRIEKGSNAQRGLL